MFEKLIKLYPELTPNDFLTVIHIQDDLDGKGDYIKSWQHPTLVQPTQEQLDAIK